MACSTCASSTSSRWQAPSRAASWRMACMGRAQNKAGCMESHLACTPCCLSGRLHADAFCTVLSFDKGVLSLEAAASPLASPRSAHAAAAPGWGDRQVHAPPSAAPTPLPSLGSTPSSMAWGTPCNVRSTACLCCTWSNVVSGDGTHGPASKTAATDHSSCNHCLQCQQSYRRDPIQVCAQDGGSCQLTMILSILLVTSRQ